MLNLALNKPATQSSTSHWSKSQIREEDAKGGNNGIISRDLGFHTAEETNPWWQVDLGGEFLVSKFAIFNRQHMAERLKRFSILSSLDGHEWTTLFTKRDASVFGKNDDLPYSVELDEPRLARFIRLRLSGYGVLHFNEIQIFGEGFDSAIRQTLLEKEARIGSASRFIPPGRNGEISTIDGFSVFVDTQNYSEIIVSSLKNGGYEGDERALVRDFVRSGDRVIEAGTAMGVVSMTAASIVGPDRVKTFDANPEIILDAQANFTRNGLSGIKSHHGVLKNRLSIKPDETSLDFYISKAFWASRLNASAADQDIVKIVQAPIFCLEDEIATHEANVLICDIEGGEVELLLHADLSRIKTIIMEVHYAFVGKAATDNMIRKLIMDGFALDLQRSANQILLLQR